MRCATHHEGHVGGLVGADAEDALLHVQPGRLLQDQPCRGLTGPGQRKSPHHIELTIFDVFSPALDVVLLGRGADVEAAARIQVDVAIGGHVQVLVDLHHC